MKEEILSLALGENSARIESRHMVALEERMWAASAGESRGMVENQGDA